VALRVSVNTRPFRLEDFELAAGALARLGLRRLELHLGHFLEGGLEPASARAALAKHELSVELVDGGWCDFARGETARVPEQIELARRLGAPRLRLFFTPLGGSEIGADGLDRIARAIERVARAHPDVELLFETHHGVGLEPECVLAILERCGRARHNVGLVFDPVNFAVAGRDPRAALGALGPFVRHVHLKGARLGPPVEHCELGAGDVDVDALLFELFDRTPSFGIEYEGSGQALLRLLASQAHLRRACAARAIPWEA
jgi:sugar phosphate isomerase/epimerase